MDVVAGDPRGVDTDLLVVTAFETQMSPLAAWNAVTNSEIDRAIASKEFSGKLYETFLTPIVSSSVRAVRLAISGLGLQGEFTVDRARRVASAVGLLARQKKIARVAFVADGPLDSPEMMQAIAEGLTLAEFEAGRYKTSGYDVFELRQLGIVVREGSREAAGEAVRRGRVIGEHCNMARALDNEPGNALRPSVFAEGLAEIARAGGLTAEVLDHHMLDSLGMGMLLGVGRGSYDPPRLVAIRYEPAGAPATPVLGLEGKGITFDTGGISIKPAADMDRMKDDMAGGAAVACAMSAMAELGAPIRVIGVIPIAENMPGGGALRPGDVLRSASGKTVEVINTDAEGRLILGDGLWYAQQMGATHLVDLATLTGAITVALGKITSGLFGTPPAFVEHVRGIAERAGDRCWPLPLFEEYKDQLRSEIADMLNTGGRPGGSITAALFLREFTSGLPWIHMDIAGTAWAEENKPFMPKGPTGVGLRTLVELAFTSQIWGKLGGQQPPVI
ncbi:MAG TPA: leucyl aminopeptidase [Vicinamibacterales bacterium]|nr:leucyl aminopeptidase [Vicinamibacterales bacterium]